jgi:hypothetical protein
MKNFILLICIFVASYSVAQKGIRIGAATPIYYSTLIDRSAPNQGLDLGFNYQAHLKLAGQIQFSYVLNPHWSVLAQTAFTPRGSKFSDNYNEYSPRYNTRYIDFGLGTAYEFAPRGKWTPFLSLALSGNSLLSAKLKNSFESIDIKSEVQDLDFSAQLSIGTNFQLNEAHHLQFAIYIDQGFSNIFKNDYSQNGLKAFNEQFGLKLGYFLEKSLNK